MLRERERERERIDEKKMAAWCNDEEEDWRKIERKRESCPPSEGASKGNFTKADPLVMNVI